MGVLFKNAEAVEVLRDVDTLMVDKAGTLTVGKPQLVSILSEGAEQELLTLTAALERGSEHPLAAAIVRAAEERQLTLPPVADFASITGKGVQGKVEGRVVAVGNRALMESLGVDLGTHESKAKEMRAQDQTVVLAAIDGDFAGLLVGADPIKESTPDAIRSSRAAGTRRDDDRENEAPRVPSPPSWASMK